MAVGLPVVCTNLSGMSELVRHPESGLLVPPGDAAELSGAISALLGDSSRRKQMGRNGREIYERNFTSERMIRRIEGIYEQCLRTG
jgi:glycosyltransferase involved in cell wall biosynthesis